jgi:hypothetical protein
MTPNRPNVAAETSQMAIAGSLRVINAESITLITGSSDVP